MRASIRASSKTGGGSSGSTSSTPTHAATIRPVKLHRRIAAGTRGTLMRQADATAIARAENEGWRVHPEPVRATPAALAEHAMRRAIARVLGIGERRSVALRQAEPSVS